MDRGGVQGAMTSVVRGMNLKKKITCHSLRHSYATHLTNNTQNNACQLINDLMNGFDIQWGNVR